MSKSIGKYELSRKLGEGGFGVVWLARDTVLGDEVALKLAFAAEEHRASLLKEARLLRSLSHAHIVRVFEADVVDDALYIAMEYLPGGNLAGRMGAEPLPLEDSLAITRSLLAALGYAHRKGVLHRDVKPANVLFDADGEAKLTDFGIARMLQHTQAASTRVGTVPYMAPEQLIGEAVFRSDLYAAGVLLYEMATGARAFEGDTDFIVMQKINSGDFKPPREANAGVSSWLEEAIVRAMARDPGGRFASAEEFVRALTPPRVEAVTAFAGDAASRGAESAKTKVITDIAFAPDLAGKNSAAARELAQGLGFSIRISSRRHDPAIPVGAVIEQIPPAGTPMDLGAAIDIVISDGPEEIPVEVPAFVGLTFKAAEAAAAKAGVIVSAAGREYHPSVSEGAVISQDIAGGSAVKAGSFVKLVLSRGPVPIEVPTFKGLLLREAEVAAQKVGLTIRIAGREYHPSVVEGAVISQDVVTGSIIKAGSVVTVVLSKGPALVTVPKFTGLSFGEAKSVAVKLGLVVKATAPEYHPSIAEGAVISQDVVAGLAVRAGSVVTLVLSKGPTQVKVPDFVGLSLSEAEKSAAKIGLALKPTGWEYHPSVVEGAVIDQDVAHGSYVDAGTLVSVVLSRGPASVRVPDLVGLSLREADETAAKGGLALRAKAREHHPSLAESAVINQDIAAGSLVKAGTVVALTLSKGPVLVKVPDFAGLSIEEVEGVAGKIGLKVEAAVRENHSSIPEGAVIGQDVVAGSTIKTGSVVVLTLSKGPVLVEVPDFTGLSIDEAGVAAAKIGLKAKAAVRENHSSIPEGAVIGQDVVVGSTIKAGSIVALTLSKGPALVKVPDFTGLPLGEAKQLAAKVDLNLITTKRENHPSIRVGAIISQELASSVAVIPGTVVGLVISNGPQSKKVPVPDLVGRTLEEAENRLAACGLVLDVTGSKYSRYASEGVVLKQSRRPGVNAREGTAVEVVISRGPALWQRILKGNWIKVAITVAVVGVIAASIIILVKSGIFPIKREVEGTAGETASAGVYEDKGSVSAPTVADLALETTIPDVVSFPENVAVRELETAGFSAMIEKRESNSVKDGLVIDQRPTAGTRLKKGAEVVIIVSKGKIKTETRRDATVKLLPVPRVAGMAETNALSRLKNAGFSVNVAYRYNDTIPGGVVINQIPASGSARAGAVVMIYVSAGPKDRESIKGITRCPSCGAVRTAGAKFCGKCGHKF